MRTFEELTNFCKEHCFNETTANYTICKELDFADCVMYPKRIKDLKYLVPVTVALLLIFLTGLLGNLSVCTVILKHPKMRTETNVYLFSLAVSDILLLLFGLAPELWYYWQMYPYVFGGFVCRLTKFLSGTGTWASALTVLAFSIERYTAICHHTSLRSRDKRVTMAVLAIWSISIAIALPAFHVYDVVADPDLIYPASENGEPSLLCQTCTIPGEEKYAYYNQLYMVTCVVFFFIPMAILMLMYIKIALFIRTHSRLARNSGIQNNCSENTKIFKVLVAVVLTFFICGAPFHYQRLTTQSDLKNQEYYRTVLVVTALFYYLSATVNPILYNVMSKRYRRAFKEIITIGTSKKEYDIKLNAVGKDTEAGSKKTITTTANTSTIR